MADLSDVEAALMNAVVQVLYPGGISVPSITGGPIKIFRGWPTSIGLNADLAANIANVSVFSDPKTTRETTRYPRVWRQRSMTAATLSVLAKGQTVTFGGVGGAGQAVGVEVDGDVCSVAVGALDTPASIAAAIAATFAGSIQSGCSVTFPGATKLVARVVGSGTSTMETRRQEQGVVVSVWCSDPILRDSIAAPLDAALSAIDWLQFPDGSAGQLLYKQTVVTDVSENAGLYRRDLTYTVDYPTIVAATNAAMLFGFGTIAPTVQATSLASTSVRESRPILGAIRFDAWYDPSDVIDQQCAAALTPASWSSRLPPNAVISNAEVNWPLAGQETIDAEIVAAVTAGIDFWAFDSYQPGDGLSRALSLYLSSARRSQLRFCMLGQASNWGDPQSPDGYSAAITRDISMMGQANYVRILGNRPVYFVLDATPAQTASLPGAGLSQAIAFVRQQAQSSGIPDPYIVWLSGAALIDYNNVPVAQQIGADAAGAYACPRLSGVTQGYADLVASAETDWVDRSATGFGMVGTAMTGWDQRPLIENPQPFYPIGPAVTSADYYTAGSPGDIAQHVTDLMTFTASHQSSCPSGLALIYAWNELVEGGWLMPTYLSGGEDRSRVGALSRSLGSWQPGQSGPATLII